MKPQAKHTDQHTGQVALLQGGYITVYIDSGGVVRRRKILNVLELSKCPKSVKNRNFEEN